MLHLILKLVEYSITIDFINPSKPAFDEEYNAVPASPRKPNEELINIIFISLFIYSLIKFDVNSKF